MTEQSLYEVEMDANQGGLTYKDIIMGQYKRITFFFNRELRGGFYTTIPTKGDENRLIYVEDTREVLSNSIRVLAIILKPKCSKETLAYYDKVNARLKLIKTRFLEKTTLKETTVLGENFYEEQSQKILLHDYKNQKVELYIRLFDKLSLQLAKLKYLQMVGGTF